jgi:hypothetical protein
MYNSSYAEAETGRSGKNMRIYQKNKAKKSCGVAQLV